MKVTLTDKQITIWDYEWEDITWACRLAVKEQVMWEELLLCAESQMNERVGSQEVKDDT